MEREKQHEQQETLLQNESKLFFRNSPNCRLPGQFVYLFAGMIRDIPNAELDKFAEFL